MDEALDKVRSMLGSDAMIVSTRTFRRGGVLGFGGREVVEVFAADTRSRIENVKRENSNRSRHSEPHHPAALSAGKAVLPKAKDLLLSGKEVPAMQGEPDAAEGAFPMSEYTTDPAAGEQGQVPPTGEQLRPTASLPRH